ncbi:FAD-dependent oxidoreductase [Dactylosporangium sp. NPDC049140]|uniref:FAD-dependent oxidoreductase n=1 Tax=Dactylosporangium sp. NPDC049140 TaxID=3155647 RepID=UPI003401118C
MQVVVNLTRCQSYAQCAFLAPDVFRMRGTEALMYDPAPADEQRERVLQAAAACPVQAILVDRVDDREAATQSATNLGMTPPRPVAPGGGDAATEALRRSGRIVIVGASLAGAAAAVTLRREGFAGELTMIGEEPYRPYDRPPLSKQVLDGWVPADHTALPLLDEMDVSWRLGVPAIGMDPAAKRVRLGDGGEVGYDRLLIATGTRARPWSDPGEAALDGVCTVRTRDDAAGLERRLAARPGRVLIIGGGFTGSEIASVCRDRDLAVTLVERGPAPMVGALGRIVGEAAAGLQRERGVDLRCGVTVTRLEGDTAGRLRRAHLSDGDTVDAEVAVVALGAIRNTEWLAGSGLAVGGWGVGCDAGCRAFDAAGVVTDDVFVAGDVARFPHPLYDYQFLALEHWGNAVAQAQIAAHNMISPATGRWPHLAVPVFWSEQFDTNIKSVGVPTLADQVVIAQGSIAQGRFVAAYGFRGRLTAAVAFNQTRWLDPYQALIEAGAPFPPALHGVDEPADARAVPAEMPDEAARRRHATVTVTGHDPSELRAGLVHHR